MVFHYFLIKKVVKAVLSKIKWQCHIMFYQEELRFINYSALWHFFPEEHIEVHG